MDKDQEMGSFSGAMDSIILDNGRMARRTEAVIGDPKKTKVIWVSGEMDKSLEMVYIQ